MRAIVEAERTTPVVLECDVLVVGGGVAGIAAALAARRAGADVLLLEREFILGGLATAGLVTIYLPLDDGTGRQVSFGIAEELLRLSIRYGAEARYPAAWLDAGRAAERADGPRFEVQFNPHLFAIAAEQRLADEGVEILYGTAACAVRREGGRLTHVVVENKSGRSAIAARAVVDATGDADICALAGVQTAVYAPGNPLAAWYYSVGKDGLALRAHGAADVPDWNKGSTPPPLTRERFAGLDGRELSRMARLSHAKTLEDLLRRRASDETLVPVTLPSIPQVRMTRRIVGLYTLDESETRKTFDDGIGCVGDWRRRGPMYQIPLRTLVSAEAANLIAAGRCVSVTDAMWDIARVIPVCAVTGEAAGAAAALGDDLRRPDARALRAHLRARGVWLGEE